MALILLRLRLHLLQRAITQSRATGYVLGAVYASAAYLAFESLTWFLRSLGSIRPWIGALPYAVLFLLMVLAVAVVDFLVAPIPTQWVKQFGAPLRKVILAQLLSQICSVSGLLLGAGTVVILVGNADSAPVAVRFFWIGLFWLITLGVYVTFFVLAVYHFVGFKPASHTWLQRHLPNAAFSTRISVTALGNAFNTYRSGWYWSDLIAMAVFSIAIAAVYMMALGKSWAFAVGLLYSTNFYLGLSIYNSLGIGGSTLWPHVTARIPGWVDRLGALLPILVLGLGLAAGASVAISALIHSDATFLTLISASLVSLFLGLSVATLLSVLLPFPVGQHGDGSVGLPRGLLSGIIGNVSGVVCLVLVFVSFGTEQAPFNQLISVALSVTALVVVVAFSGHALERRYVHLMSTMA